MDKTKAPIQKYWDWRSRNFGYDSDKSDGIANAWETTLNQLLPSSDGKQALDVGTGMGQFAFYLARSGFKVTGIDISEKMVLNARRKAEAENLTIDFDTGDAESLKFEDDAFDVIVARNVLWTLPNPQKALLDWRRVLKPGGKIVVSDGLWQNTTWKRFPQLAYKSVKDLVKNNSFTPLRFFLSYMNIKDQLPFYEGMKAQDMDTMMKKVGFKQIRFFDTSLFDIHPYRGDGSHIDKPLFFIAYAYK